MKSKEDKKSGFPLELSFLGFVLAVANLLLWEFYIVASGGWPPDFGRGDFAVPLLVDFPVSFLAGALFVDLYFGTNGCHYAVIFFGTVLWYFVGQFLERLVEN